MQKSEKFLYLALLTSSSNSWRVESNWLNFQSNQVASSWKYEQFDSISIRVQNVNLKLDLTISLKLNYFLQVNWMLNYFLWMICRLNCFLWAICKLNYFLWMIHELSCFLWVNWEWDWEEVTSLTLNEKFSSCWLRS